MTDLFESSAFFGDGGQPRILLMKAEHDGRIDPHSHEFYEIVYIVDGFTLHSSRGRVNMLVTGDLFFVRPGEEHSYINAYRTKLYNLLFMPDELESFREELSGLPGLSAMLSDETGESTETAVGANEPSDVTRLLHVGMNERSSVEALLDGIRNESSEKKPGWQTMLRVDLVAFLVKYSRMYEAGLEHRSQSSNDYYGYIYRILGYVNDNYKNVITTTELAEFTGLSPDYMSRKFKQALGMSPAEYVRRFRIARAMEMLCTTDAPIAEIAAETGFSDISLFSRVFKQAVGLPPAAYRRKLT